MVTAQPEGGALDPQGPVSEAMANLFWLMLGLGGAVFVAVVVALGLGLFRRRPVGEPQPDRQGRDSFGRWFVVGGVVVPLVILVIVFGATVRAMRFVPTTAPPEALAIEVVGHQFWWEARYPNGNVVTANEIHIPVRTPVVVSVTSDDVIHSFWVPELNRKMDLEPGRTNQVEIYASKVGRYRGQCAEFCGLQHAHMAFWVFADPPAVFARWLDREQRPATQTSQLFLDKCSNCHQIQGTPATAKVGPDLTHVGSRTTIAAGTIPNTLADMEQWIAHPQEVKPGNLMPDLDLTDGQVHELATYLESLK
jgi:cytochrome c oxidase subunit II